MLENPSKNHQTETLKQTSLAITSHWDIRLVARYLVVSQKSGVRFPYVPPTGYAFYSFYHQPPGGGSIPPPKTIEGILLHSPARCEVPHELDPEKINKRYRSNMAQYHSDGAHCAMRFLAESYVWMVADRDFWKEQAMYLLMEKRKNRG